MTLSSLPPGASRLVDYALERLALAEGSLELIPHKTFGSIDDKRVGEWAPDERRLTIAFDRSDWFYTLAHELGHVEQTLSGRFKLGGSAWDIFDNWLAAKTKISDRQILCAVRAIQRCEHDAERHALSLIRAFDLPGSEAYAQEANAYLWKHEIARKTRKWFASKDSLAVCPKTLIPLKALGTVPTSVESVMLSGDYDAGPDEPSR